MFSRIGRFFKAIVKALLGDAEGQIPVSMPEYSVREIRAIFREAGFPKQHVYIGARGLFLRCPAFLVETIETTIEWLPHVLRRRVAKIPILRALLGVRVAGIKGSP